MTRDWKDIVLKVVEKLSNQLRQRKDNAVSLFCIPYVPFQCHLNWRQIFSWILSPVQVKLYPVEIGNHEKDFFLHLIKRNF